MNKADLINEVRSLLNADKRPGWLIFRQYDGTPRDKYWFQGKLLTRKECASIPARKHIFVNRRNLS
jgi:hypothetical protein